MARPTKDKIAVLDFETTGVLGPTALPLDQQPFAIDIGLIIIQKAPGLPEVESFTSLINPGIDIPDEASKINGISDAMVKDAPGFAGIYSKLVDLIFGCSVLVAHNLPFDRGILASELQRIGRLYQFPWPPEHICTCEETEHLEGKMLKQEALFKMATGEDAGQTHRAFDDVGQLVTILRWIQKEEKPEWLG